MKHWNCGRIKGGGHEPGGGGHEVRGGVGGFFLVWFGIWWPYIQSC